MNLRFVSYAHILVVTTSLLVHLELMFLIKLSPIEVAVHKEDIKIEVPSGEKKDICIKL